MKIIIAIAILTLFVVVEVQAGRFQDIRAQQIIQERQRQEYLTQQRAIEEQNRVNAILFRDAEKRAKRGVSTLVINSDGSWSEIRHASQHRFLPDY